jgi:hypothetical protein
MKKRIIFGGLKVLKRTSVSRIAVVNDVNFINLSNYNLSQLTGNNRINRSEAFFGYSNFYIYFIFDIHNKINFSSLRVLVPQGLLYGVSLHYLSIYFCLRLKEFKNKISRKFWSKTSKWVFFMIKIWIISRQFSFIIMVINYFQALLWKLKNIFQKT